MRMRFLLQFLVLGIVQLAILSSAGAEDCSSVDLAPQMGPVRNQGDVGWCYANAASDLLSFRYRTELKGKPVSAFYTALSFNETYYNNMIASWFVDPQTAEGGLISLALKNAMTNGFCPGLSDARAQVGKLSVSLKEKLKASLDLKEAYDRNDVSGFRSLLTKIRKSDNFLNQLMGRRLDQALRSTTGDNFLKVVADQLCEGKKIVPRETALVRASLGLPGSFLHSALTTNIDSQLSLQNPVGVDYYATFFRGWNLPLDASEKHASVIVGREMRGGQCYYKLRNSWGPNCHYENPDFKQGADCDKGYLWIPRAKFGDYLYGVTFLEPQGRSIFKSLRDSNLGFAF